jgi:hypothetical protein
VAYRADCLTSFSIELFRPLDLFCIITTRMKIAIIK